MGRRKNLDFSKVEVRATRVADGFYVMVRTQWSGVDEALSAVSTVPVCVRD